MKQAFTAILLVAGLALSLGGAASAQIFFPQKDLVFAEVAAGGGYETVITVTNRGVYTYSGNMYFYRNCGEVWNPIVNGSTISGGILNVSIPVGNTVTYRVTAGSLEAGFAYLYSDDVVLDNFVEGNLTYNVVSGMTVLDSIGIGPSTELYLSTVPFESFSTIALAFVNPDFIWNRTATVNLRLYNATGGLLATTSLNLAPLCHYPRFLSELFPGYNPGAGRVDIQTDDPVAGAALTLNQGQLSSLPLQPSPVSYDMTAVDVGGITTRGEVTIWAEGRFVKGYLRVTEFDGVAMDAIFPVSGRLINGNLRMSFYGSGPAFDNSEAVIYTYIPGFTFGTVSTTVEYVETFVNELAVTYGTLYLDKFM